MLSRKLLDALQRLALMEATWTISMVDSYYQQALKLRALGLVEFKPRYVRRSKYRGQPNGYDVVMTPAGMQSLGKKP